MIKSPYSNDTKSKPTKIHLPGIELATPSLISLIGAGGKTTTLFSLAHHFKQQGLSVLITTTTQMCLPEPIQYDQFIINTDPNLLFTQLTSLPSSPHITYCCSSHDPQSEKVKGVEMTLLDQVKLSGIFDVILVEADGAKRLPLKAPAGHEPCIPNSSDWVIAITGVEMINVPAQPEKIHRWPLFSQITGIQAGDALDADVFIRFINHPEGMFKHTPERAGRSWILNKVSQNDNSLTAFAQHVLSHAPKLNTLWLAAMQQDPAIKACWINTPAHLDNDLGSHRF